MPRATIVTKGKVVPAKGVRVMIGKLAYIITKAEEPTPLDDFTVVTDVEIQPGAAGKFDGSPLINAKLIGEMEPITYE